MIISISNEQKLITKAKTKTKQTTKPISRNDKALALAEGVMKSSTTDSYFVPSQSVNGKVYEVSLVGKQHVCTCPDFEHRQSNNTDDGGLCKHILAVKLYIEQKEHAAKLIKQVATTAARNETAQREAQTERYLNQEYLNGGFD
jgi:predicted nucleic acid-binding Zn finger protein